MGKNKNILTDSFQRKHTYLRISLTERCNLRCTYCMPEQGIPLSPKSHLMTADEIYTIAKIFVNNGVTKIRLTGGEPLVRNDVDKIISKLSLLPVDLSITTNAVVIDKYINTLKTYGVKHINVSLDSLKPEKFKTITRRNHFKKVYNNILLLISEGFTVKVNTVLIKNFNDDEVIDFIKLTKQYPISVRFIEFMPFDGNKWDLKKTVSFKEIINNKVLKSFPQSKVIKLKDDVNDTAKNYKIKNYKGSFAIISSVTNPFCDSCNRLRLTANGHLKNCLFSETESDLLTSLRLKKDITSIIQKAVQSKLKIRSGMDTLKKFKNPLLYSKNRSMTSIGG